jgi:hypothetical protein
MFGYQASKAPWQPGRTLPPRQSGRLRLHRSKEPSICLLCLLELLSSRWDDRRVNTFTVARGTIVSDPPAAPASINKNVEPQVQVLSMRLVYVQLGSQYCGLASDPEQRTVTAQEPNKRARHDI